MFHDHDVIIAMVTTAAGCIRRVESVGVVGRKGERRCMAAAAAAAAAGKGPAQTPPMKRTSSNVSVGGRGRGNRSDEEDHDDDANPLLPRRMRQPPSSSTPPPSSSHHHQQQQQQQQQHQLQNDAATGRGAREQRQRRETFSRLCEQVLACLVGVDSSLAELFALKDQLLEHKLPPALLAYLTITASRVFRSKSDLQGPLFELVRLVRLHSADWEEHTRSLEAMQTQLDDRERRLTVAVRRLEMTGMQYERARSMRRVSMWERLFSRVVAHQGQSMRWRYMLSLLQQETGGSLQTAGMHGVGGRAESGARAAGQSGRFVDAPLVSLSEDAEHDGAGNVSGIGATTTGLSSQAMRLLDKSERRMSVDVAAEGRGGGAAVVPSGPGTGQVAAPPPLVTSERLDGEGNVVAPAPEVPSATVAAEDMEVPIDEVFELFDVDKEVCV
jgi:stress response protein SCP2